MKKVQNGCLNRPSAPNGSNSRKDNKHKVVKTELLKNRFAGCSGVC